MRQGQEPRAHLPSADLLAQALRVAGVARLHHAGQNALLQYLAQVLLLITTNPRGMAAFPCKGHALKRHMKPFFTEGLGGRPGHKRQRALNPRF